MVRNTIGLAILAAAVTACSGNGTKLTVSSQAKTSAAAATTPATPATQCTSGDVTLEEVWLVVRHVQIEGGDLCAPPAPTPTPTPTPTPGLRTASSESGGSCQDGMGGSGESCDGDPGHDQGETCDDSDHDGLPDDCQDGDGECELKAGPFAVVLSGQDLASGKVEHAFDMTVPAGTYDELDILVNTIPVEKAGTDAILQQMAAEHASVLVKGTMKTGDTSTPFTWKTNVAFKQEKEPFTIPATGGNVTLQLDTSQWFCEPGSCNATTLKCTTLDPTQDSTRTQIARNIRASFRVLHDDDRDGQDDAEEHRGAGSHDGGH